MAVKSKAKAEAKSPGFSVYIGPTIVGVIYHCRIFRCSRADALKKVEPIIQKYPPVSALIVSGDQLADSLEKIKTPGNLLYENYRRLCGKSKKEANK